MKILLIDNYDSFTYNIIEYCRTVGFTDITIVKNDEFVIFDALQYEKIIISPGPKTPKESGLIIPFLQAVTTQSVLGICLGHQAIAEAFGEHIYQLSTPYHGFETTLNLTEQHFIFNQILMPMQIGLYHSWAVSPIALQSALQVTSVSAEGIIMSLKHKTLNIHGVQFHPESFITKSGLLILKNWLEA